LPIVGIGASAGGLDAFKKFFSALPPESGMAFVLIQHLDPTRESLTAELVGTYASMRVVQVEDGMRVEANRVYVIPPNAYLSIRRRILRLTVPSAPRSLRMAIDFFFRSLAEDQHENAIGVILSGTGTDGTLGLKEIKAVGGMTMVQDPPSGQHDGMPRSAITAGYADYVLPAEQMADALLAYVRHAAVVATSVARLPDEAPGALARALALLHKHTKFDFAGYKTGTLRRRIQRRMSLKRVNDLAKYVEVLRDDPEEVTALFRDLLINVTRFFREPEAWQVLQEQVIRRWVAEKDPNASVRVWGAPSDRREIQLQARARKGMVEVTVRDTGSGVSAAAAERMFEPFFTTKPYGLGMGLAISRSILEAHEGHIWVKHRADGGPGTTAGFTLPLRPSRAAAKRRTT
jgi:two-component system CheB/CheR fusion protein